MSQPPDLKPIAQALCAAATLPGLEPKDVDQCESSRLKFICYSIASRLHDDPSALLAALGLQAVETRPQVERDEPYLMKLMQVLASYEPGSHEWDWDAEIADLEEREGDYLDMLTTSVQETGMQRPVVLGSDGRVWDGHHRIAVALRLALETIPVEIL